MDVPGLTRRALGLEGKALTAADYAESQPRIYGDNGARRRISSNVAHQHLQAYGGDQAIDWVMDCVQLRMETASNAEYHFERKGTKLLTERTDAAAPYERQAPRSLVELMANPNPWFTYSDLMELLVIDLMLVGNGFWLKHQVNREGQPLALYRLAPPLVTVIPGTTQLIDAYEYKVPGEQPIEFAPEQVVHFRMPNPHKDGAYLGLGLIAGGPRVYDAELALTETQASFFERGAKLSGVLTTERQLTDTLRRKISRTFHALYGGPRNAGEIPVLERGMKFQSIQPNAQEAAFAELANQSRDRICAMARTPLELLGYMGNSDRQAVKEAQRIYDTKTMRPFLNRIERRASAALTQAWGVDFKIDYDYVMPIEDALDLATGLATLPGIRVREVRAAALLEPLGDKRDDIVLNLPGSNDNRSKVKDRNLPGEPGRPPLPENTAAIPEPGQPMPKDAAVSA